MQTHLKQHLKLHRIMKINQFQGAPRKRQSFVYLEVGDQKSLLAAMRYLRPQKVMFYLLRIYIFFYNFFFHLAKVLNPAAIQRHPCDHRISAFGA